MFIYFSWWLIALQYCGGFFHMLRWISHRYTCPPILNPCPIPLGCPSALALSAIFYASNLDWSSVSHMVIYMFQRCSLKSPHPHLLTQSSKVCCLHLCFFCCLAYGVVTILISSSLWAWWIFPFVCYLQFLVSILQFSKYKSFPKLLG